MKSGLVKKKAWSVSYMPWAKLFLMPSQKKSRTVTWYMDQTKSRNQKSTHSKRQCFFHTDLDLPLEEDVMTPIGEDQKRRIIQMDRLKHQSESDVTLG